VAALVARFPEQRDLIVAYDERWTEMLGGPIDGTVAVLADLRRAGIRVAALSNWSADTFPIARSRYPFLGWFETIVISGEIGICKPDPRIYRLLFERTGLVPESSVFVDDVEANVAAASALGMTGLRFESPAILRRQLEDLELLPRVSSPPPPGR
jgi:2-haloacid dehalogenase